jgi:hypothetical protein
MGEKVLLYKRAGTVIRVLAWISVVVVVGVVAAILIPFMVVKTPQAKSMPPFLLLMIVPVLLVWFQFALANAIQAHKEWGRIVGIIYGALHLLGFPIGTIIGGYILWCLIKGWDEEVSLVPESSGQGN